MKSSVWLRNIFSVTYYLMIIGWIIFLGLLVFAIFVNSGKILEFMSESQSMSIDSKEALYTILTYALISGVFWIYLVRVARNLMDSLISGILFTKLQVASFKLIGQILILLTIIDAIVNFIFKLIFNNHLSIKLGFLNFWFVISIGLFMIFLSTIFDKAKTYKEENDLTI